MSVFLVSLPQLSFLFGSFLYSPFSIYIAVHLLLSSSYRELHEELILIIIFLSPSVLTPPPPFVSFLLLPFSIYISLISSFFSLLRNITSPARSFHTNSYSFFFVPLSFLFAFFILHFILHIHIAVQFSFFFFSLRRITLPAFSDYLSLAFRTTLLFLLMALPLLSRSIFLVFILSSILHIYWCSLSSFALLPRTTLKALPDYLLSCHTTALVLSVAPFTY